MILAKLFYRRTLAGAILFLLIGCIEPLQPSVAPRPKSRDSLRQMKSRAGTQHEIVMLLLNKREYAKAAMEANKIFDMAWPDNQEPLLLKELLILSDHFRRQGQAALGLQMIERNSKCKYFKTNSSRIEILKEQGYLYKNLRQNDKALGCFQKARELEHKN
jgi:hypothetical protein